MAELRLLDTDDLPDELDLTVRLESARQGLEVVADRLAVEVEAGRGGEPFAVALAGSFRDLQRTVRSLRAALRVARQ